MPRSTSGRLSIDESYHPCTMDPVAGVPPRCVATRSAPPAAVLELAARASRAARETGAPEAFHVAALIDLLWRDSAGIGLDRAVKALETSVRLSATPSPALSDLSAAYLMRFDLNGDVRDLLAALESAERATQERDASAALLFTRARVLARLELVDHARAAWDAYLAQDRRSAWAGEASRHRAALDTAPSHASARGRDASLPADPQGARLLATDSLLPAWGTMMLANDTVRAAALFSRAERLGTALVGRKGDESVSAMVQAIRHASPEARRRLAAAHAAYGIGVRAFARGDYLTCSDAVTPSQHTDPTPGALDAWSRVLYLSCVLHASAPAWSITQFTAVANTADRQRFPALVARAYWGLATSLNKAGRQVDAFSAIREAQQLFARIGESENYGATLHIEALSRVELHEGADAFVALRRALHQLRGERQSVWLHNVLWIYATAANDAGFPRAALAFSTEGVRVADRRGDPRVMAESRLARARYALAVGSAATVDLDSAARLIARIPAGPAREWQEADLLSLRRQAGASLGFGSTALDTVVAAFRRVGTPTKLVPALLARSEQSIRAGRGREAERDLDDATAVLDHARRTTADTTQLNRATDGVRDALRHLASLWIGVGEPAASLAALERSRSVGVGTAAVLTGGARATAPGHVVASLALLGDSLASWTLARGQLHFDIRPFRRADFLSRMTRLRTRLELGLSAATLKAELIALYDDVLRTPLSHAGADATALTIVGDDQLTSLPLAAAFDTATGQHLMQRYRLRFAGSVARALLPEPLSAAADRVLAIGDPAFDPTSRPGLTRLRGADGEVADLRAEYPGAMVFTDTAATVSAVVRSLPQATLLHFAGHARFDVRHPDRSELVLARGRSGDRAVLLARDIRTLPLRQVQLVVLSACESAVAGAEQHAGMNGLVQAFLGSGAHGVLGSMWRIDDRRTRALMAAFHRAYRTSHDAAESLRRAQQTLLQSDPASIGAWSAFKYEIQ